MDQQTVVTLLMGLAVSAFLWFGLRRRVSRRSFGPSPAHPPDSSLDAHFALAGLSEPNHADSSALSPSHHAPMLETSSSVDHGHSGFDGGTSGGH